jgi:hypothetical protein
LQVKVGCGVVVVVVVVVVVFVYVGEELQIQYVNGEKFDVMPYKFNVGLHKLSS